MTRKLDRDEWRKVITTATVVGSGTFPFDMLRYDNAWPSREDDASAMYPHRDRAKERREVRICTLYSFTPERWQSFGWACRVDEGSVGFR